MPHPNQHYLFAYGSSRRGENDDVAVFDTRTVFINRAFVRGRLYDLGAHPGVALDPVASWVTGELYLISSVALEAVDNREREVRGFHRTQALVHDAAGGAWPCWIYLPPNAPAHRHAIIPGGDWVRYRRIRDRREGAAMMAAFG
jgi:gamma-glutamylcyclotransferase (GGCT)/AIG2-like uncharacterized protein YtfP